MTHQPSQNSSGQTGGESLRQNDQNDSLDQIKLSMKLKTPARANFSRYARLCDQTFYHDSEPVQRPIQQIPQMPKPQKKLSSACFTSVSRDKRGNFRNSIYLPVGEFSHHPNHTFGKNRSPSWSFCKTQKYKKNVLVEYEVCERNPLLSDDEELKMKASATSMRETLRDKVKAMHSTTYSSTKERNVDPNFKEAKHCRNYSILSQRETSSVGFFAQSKIKHPRYLSKEDLNVAEGQLDEKHYQQKLKPCPNGYIEFSKRRARNPNSNSKGFQTVLYSYSHEKQFNNYSQTQYPTGPEGHINMKSHLDRPDYTPNRLGPNTDTFKIDITRPSISNIDLNLSTFRDKITTRYDRMEPEPNTRLDYEAKAFALAGLLQMNRMQGRNPELFPIVDPAIKKAGDVEMKQDLKKCIPIVEINQALRPKNIENFCLLMKEQK